MDCNPAGIKVYPTVASEYQLLESVGHGATATAYRAKCIPFDEVVAVKCIELDSSKANLDDIRREAKTMSLIEHTNLLKAYTSFIVDRRLWVVMPFMEGGSCLDIIRTSFSNGFEEDVIATILKESLRALEYLHRHGHIHRDFKAGNILIDAKGSVKLGDFGVTACLFESGDRQHCRKTFVGTPCWMAPEVMEQLHGYDFKADIWSFGITALELAHGHAPFSKYPPAKVLLMTLQNSPPTLNDGRDKRFSKAFKEMVATCLIKNPAKRPTAEKLLTHAFFKAAKSTKFTMHPLVNGLPPLKERLDFLKLNFASKLNKMNIPYEDDAVKIQNEYNRGVSSWNFNVEDLKAQMALESFDLKNGRSGMSPNLMNGRMHMGESSNQEAGEDIFQPDPSEVQSPSDALKSYGAVVDEVSLLTKVASDAKEERRGALVQTKGRFRITTSEMDLFEKEVSSKKELELLQTIADLQSRISTLLDTQQELKSKNLQLEHQLDAFYKKEKEERMQGSKQKGNERAKVRVARAERMACCF